MKNKKVKIVKTQKRHMKDIVELLQSISNYRPKDNQLNSIWDSFKNQKNLHSFVVLVDNKPVGYGSIIIETKIRGGKVGHIEDIVSHKDFQKMGIGKLVLSSLFKIAKKINAIS